MIPTRVGLSSDIAVVALATTDDPHMRGAERQDTELYAAEGG